MPTIQEQLHELTQVVEQSRVLVPQIEAFLPPLIATLRQGGKLLTCGNGGSAADALHMAEEFVGKYRGNRRALPAICLNADATALTCIANDWSYDHVFSRQVEAHGKAGDFLFAFSTSGNSQSIVKALETARQHQLTTVAFLGKDGGACKELAHHALIVPSNNTARIQEIHGWMLHVVLEAVEAENW